MGGSILILLLACLSHPASSQERAALKTIRIGMPNRGVAQSRFDGGAALWLLSRTGIGSGTDRHAAEHLPSDLDGGDLDYSTALASGARASVSGLPLRIIMALTVGQDFSLVVRPDIRRMEDLKGKTLAVSGVGEFTDVGARLMLKKIWLGARGRRQTARIVRQPSVAIERAASGADRRHGYGDALQQDGREDGLQRARSFARNYQNSSRRVS